MKGDECSIIKIELNMLMIKFDKFEKIGQFDLPF
jgi:hypothetical protein